MNHFRTQLKIIKGIGYKYFCKVFLHVTNHSPGLDRNILKVEYMYLQYYYIYIDSKLIKKDYVPFLYFYKGR